MSCSPSATQVPAVKAYLPEPDRERLCSFFTSLSHLVPSPNEFALLLQKHGLRAYVNGSAREGVPTVYVVHLWYFMNPEYKVSCTSFVTFRKFSPLVCWSGQREAFDEKNALVLLVDGEWRAAPQDVLTAVLKEHRK